MSIGMNPYIAGSPVTGTEMFFGREDVFTFIHQALIGKHRDNIIVLCGQRRTGKTSMLYQLPSRLGANYLCVFVDLQALRLEGIDGFLWELANHIQRTLQREHQIELPPLEHEVFMADARNFFQYKFLDQVWSAIEKRHLLLMLDEAIRLEEQVQAGKLEHQVFEYMSHLMQHYEQLNFLFSLGSGLEAMEKEYALLFRTAVYKKISFLDRDSANALMTNPVKAYYEVEPAAQEYIFKITSGHPYCTQLLCHGLFSRWQQHPEEQITIQDVVQVLDETVERGLAVFKHIWDESTPAEKAVMAAMASITSDAHTDTPIDRDAINRSWKRYNVSIPWSEMAKALKSLISRDIIMGEDKYAFAVDLQRLWIQKYKRFDWVAEEIEETMRQWAVSGKSGILRFIIPVPAPRTSTGRQAVSARTLLLTVLAFILVVSGSMWGKVAYDKKQYELHSDATATAHANVFFYASQTAMVIASTYPFSNRLILSDPLISNDLGYGWDNYGTFPDSRCSLTYDGYHIVENQPGYFQKCAATKSNFKNFTFEVTMNIKSGGNNAEGGMIFRGDENNDQYYDLFIDTQGNYRLDIQRSSSGEDETELFNGTAPVFHAGLNQNNIISIEVSGTPYNSEIKLYINYQFAHGVPDTTYSSGQIGFVANDPSSQKGPAEVVYTDAKVWLLP